MELFEGDLDLLLEDISLLMKELNSKNKNNKEEIVISIAIKQSIYEEISGNRLEEDPSIFSDLPTFLKNFEKKVKILFLKKRTTDSLQKVFFLY